MMHYDYSGQDEKLGVKRTAIYAGQFKRIAGDERPLSAEGQAYLQQMVDTFYGIFLDGVGHYRGLDSEMVHERMGDGRVFIGKKALKAGLVDRLGNFNDALALARDKGDTMMGSLTKETLRAQHPELVQALLAEGAASVTFENLMAENPEATQRLRTEGETQERSRVVEILEAEGDAAISIQAIKEGTGAAATVKLLLQAEKEGRAKTLADLRQAAPSHVGTDPPKIEIATDPEQLAKLPIENRALKEWEGDAKLAGEFGKFETYLAYRRAEDAGQVTQ